MSACVCDLWVLVSSDFCNGKTLKLIHSGLDRRSLQDKFSYKLVTVENMMIGVVQCQLCIYLDGRREEHLPKVAFVYLPNALRVSPHTIHAVRHLEGMGVKCVNSSTALSICRNKVQQLQLVVSQGVPLPDTVTYAVSSVQGLPNLLSQPHNIGFPAILKHNASSGGKRVMLLSNEETVEDIVHSLKDDDVYMLQHYVKESHGTHIRAVVIGDTVHGVYRATNLSNSRVQSNASLGGKWSTIESDADIESMALKVTHTFGLDLAGVDFVEEVKGQRLFLEANACPALNWDDTIVDHLIDYLRKRMCEGQVDKGEWSVARAIGSHERERKNRCEGQTMKGK